ncbi:MAG: hypothetical protein WD738_13510 [Pirellulales bacterium]
MEAGSVWLVTGWIALHAAALAAACGTRIAAGSCVENLMQLCFFAAMAVIGATAWICQQFDLGWCWSAITLVAMVLTAVIDFRRMSEPARGAFAGS